MIQVLNASVAIGGSGERLTASSILRFDGPESARKLLGRQVLLCLTDDEPSVAVIIGELSDTLWPAAETGEESAGEHDSVPERLADRRIAIEAEDALILKCGKSEIQLRRDGDVLVKGNKITSRARSRNKIRGASVEIN